VRWLWRGHVRQRLAFLIAAVVLMALDGSMLGALSLLIEPLFDQVLVGGRGDSSAGLRPGSPGCSSFAGQPR
jgi:ATP-binding cassette, subfamily B, bacterial MsbA